MMNQEKERNLLAGIDFMTVTGGVIAFFMLILNIFTVTVEVFLRKDMGQRYFNPVNFYAGMMVFAFFAFFVNALSSFGSSFGRSTSGSGWSSFIFLIWFVYVIIGIYHFIRQWWRDAVNNPVHSLSAGDPHLEPLGRLIMKLANVALAIPVRIFAQTLQKEGREQLPALLPVLQDSRDFTYRVAEPILVLIAGILVSSFGSGLVGTWLTLSAIALVFSANVAAEAERHRILDMQDRQLEAASMKAAMQGESKFMYVKESTKRTFRNMAERIEEAPEVMKNIETSNPTIAEALAAVNPKLRSIGGKEEGNET